MNSVRLHAVARAAYGIALVGCTSQAVRLFHAPPDDKWTTAVTRALGLRHISQAVVTLVMPTRKGVLAGAFVDVVHGASDVLAAAAKPRWHRAATTDAVVAFSSAGTAMLQCTTVLQRATAH
jgi:hypothetical protein